MSHKLTRLHIERFRGIRRLNLPLDGRSLIVVGENGAGKSSIIDALEFCITGHIDKLKGRQDVSEKASIPHLAGGPTTVEIFCTGHEDKPIRTTFPEQAPQVPQPLRRFHKLANGRPFILRRSQILAFINARPSNRYAQISDLIGLGDIDQIESVWRQQKNTFQNEIEGYKRDEIETLRRMAALLEMPRVDEETIITAVNARLQEQGLLPISSLAELQAREVEISQDRSLTELVALSRRWNAAVEGLETLQTELLALQEKNRQRLAALEAFLQTAAAFDAEAALVDLLTIAERDLSPRPSIPTCPLCEADIPDRDAFLDGIRQRLRRLQDLSDQQEEIRSATRTFAQGLLLAERILDANASMLNNLNMDGAAMSLLALREELAPLRRQLDEQRPGLDAGPTLERGLERLTDIHTRLSRRAATHAAGDELASRVRLIQLLPRLNDQWQALVRCRRRIRAAASLLDQIDLVHEALLAARNRGIEKLRETLEEDFERFYKQLHPAEGYESIRIPIQEGRRASVDLSTTFHHEAGSHPLNFFSEGHLDSLGLCIFLAFIKNFNQDLKIIALDDVLTTVDAGHRLRVARLLAREFADYQIVITTHDQLWAEQLARALPQARMVPLRQWSLAGGTDVWAYQPEWDYYASLAGSGRPADAIGAAGRALEKFLFQMRHNLQLAVPAKPNEAYTIGDLYGPFFAWLDRHPPFRPDRTDFPGELALIRGDLDEVWRLRNWAGAHFNEWAAGVTSSEALDFVDTVRRLAASFECPACQNLVAYRRQAGALLCPTCDPAPGPQVAWEYDPNWVAYVAGRLARDDERINRSMIFRLRAVWEGFLRDMRRRVGLAVPAAPDEKYGVEVLHQPFLDRALAVPPPAPEGAEPLAELAGRFPAFLGDEGWVDLPPESVHSFFELVRAFTTHFACPTCAGLLSFEPDDQRYACAACRPDGAEEAAPPAFWPVSN